MPHKDPAARREWARQWIAKKRAGSREFKKDEAQRRVVYAERIKSEDPARHRTMSINNTKRVAAWREQEPDKLLKLRARGRIARLLGCSQREVSASRELRELADLSAEVHKVIKATETI